MPQQIILKNLQRPKEINIEVDIGWQGNNSGFSAGRDTERVTAQILQNILKEVADRGSTSTEKTSDKLELHVQKINYHLKTLMDSGFLYREKRLKFVRQGSIRSAVEEMRGDANRIFENLSRTAEEIDSTLSFKNRYMYC
jgi:predicted transcriptional regulator